MAGREDCDGAKAPVTGLPPVWTEDDCYAAVSGFGFEGWPN